VHLVVEPRKTTRKKARKKGKLRMRKRTKMSIWMQEEQLREAKLTS
jgi:hypothetical protein